MFRTIILAAALVAQPAFAAAFKSDRIAVATEGKGRDVVLVHGLGSSPRVWKGTIQRVPGYRYHLVRIAGMGGEPVGANGTGLVVAPVADEIARYITEQRLKAPALIGHSMGGTIGLMVAARHPGSISRLMVVDMFPFIGQMFMGPQATSETVKPIAEQLRTRTLGLSPEQRKAEREATIVSMIRTESERAGPIADTNATDITVSTNAFSELVVTDLRAELPKIKVPTTILYVTPTGAPFSDAQIDTFYQASYTPIAGAAIKRVPNAAHFIMLDAPDAFAGEVRAFLGR